MIRIFFRFLLLSPLFISTSSLIAQKEGDQIKGELIVQLRQQKSTSSFELSIQEKNMQIRQVLSQRLGIYLVTYDTLLTNANEALQLIRFIPDVLQAQHNHVIALREANKTIPDDTYFNQQWALNNTGQNDGVAGADIDAVRAWNISTGGVTVHNDTIVVAVIDAGCDLLHEDLNLFKNHHEIPGNGIDDDNNGYLDDYNGWNAYDNNSNIPLSQHGTHIAGIVGAIGNNSKGVAGVNWDVKILPVAGSSSSEATVVAALGYVYAMRKQYDETLGQQGAFIVATNNSFGVDFGQPENYPVWASMYDSLGMLGILHAASTANLNINVDSVGDIPASFESLWLIGITNTTGQDKKNSDAGFGLQSIDFGAPGTNIYSTRNNNSYGYSTGTSMSSPHVSGAVALLISAADSTFMKEYKENPSETSLRLKFFLLAGTDPVDDLKGKTVTGGRLNVFQSMHHLLSRPLSLLPDTLKVSLPLNSDTFKYISVYNTGIDSLTIQLHPFEQYSWLQFHDTVFTIEGSSSADFVIQLNSTGLSAGYYDAIIIAEAEGSLQKSRVIRMEVFDPHGIESIRQNKIHVKAIPNPFANSVNLELSMLSVNSSVELQISDASGQIVFESRINPDNYSGIFVWDGFGKNGKACAQGVYYFKITAKDHFATGKLIKL
ncbi:MAG: hypothetical protein CVT92_01710 [Bacteroidetes bacterium HGW-Bacteroidetes-1]|jgi:subtilisin family serine protease|nr:MAG: hypothetical protein CVT92_01710 [Bacteroidetes bacterium HGW-Bacteroidetes-1]